MSKAIEHIRNICKTQTVPEDEYKWIDPVLELSDSIKALTERVDVLTERVDKIFAKPEQTKMPPTGPIRFDPVLNDGKADPVHEAICKAPDNTFICQQCGHVHELPQFQQSPFVTGLSVLDTLKK